MWTREGYWQNGKLLNGKRGSLIHDPTVRLIKKQDKTPSQADKERARRDFAKLMASMPDFLTGTRHRRLERV